MRSANSSVSKPSGGLDTCTCTGPLAYTCTCAALRQVQVSSEPASQGPGCFANTWVAKGTRRMRV